MSKAEKPDWPEEPETSQPEQERRQEQADDPDEPGSPSTTEQQLEPGRTPQPEPAGVLEGELGQDVLASTAELLSMSLTARRAPYPDPDEMQGFKDVQADLPERIFRQWERETEHRQALERRIVGANITNRSRGQLIGAGLASLVILVGFVLILLDKDVAGLVTLLPAVAVLVGRFIVHELRTRRGPNGMTGNGGPREGLALPEPPLPSGEAQPDSSPSEESGGRE